MSDNAPDFISEDTGPGIQKDKNGDPLPQGTRMVEYESYERVIEGLKLAADACMHLIRQEPESAVKWRGLCHRLDQCRRICIQHAGIDDVIRAKETTEVRGDPMRWKDARKRFREGCVQAAGGARQLAVCFRNDLTWSQIATSLEAMERSSRTPKLMVPRRGLILPPHLTRQ